MAGSCQIQANAQTVAGRRLGRKRPFNFKCGNHVWESGEIMCLGLEYSVLSVMEIYEHEL